MGCLGWWENCHIKKIMQYFAIVHFIILSYNYYDYYVIGSLQMCIYPIFPGCFEQTMVNESQLVIRYSQ